MKKKPTNKQKYGEAVTGYLQPEEKKLFKAKCKEDGHYPSWIVTRLIKQYISQDNTGKENK